MKIALFGGSFNPIHNTHLYMANKVITEKLVEEVWFVPCGDHPFEKDVILGEKRLEMLKLALNNVKFKIIDYEINKRGKSFTSETIKHLKNKFKDDEFYFIMGADNIEKIGEWHDFEYIKNNVKFILFTRPGYKINDCLQINVARILETKDGLSSTKVRENIKNSKKLDLYVNSKVKKYLVDGGFYDKKV